MSTEQCRDPKKLHPVVATMAIAALEECNRLGLNMAFTETYRSIERQDYLYEQGRTRPGAIVTNAKGSSMSSYHQWGLAVDIHHNVNGNLYPVDTMKKAADIFKKHGFEWGGDWKDFKDTPHFQYTQGLSISDLKAGKTLKVDNHSNNVKINIVEKASGQLIETVVAEAINKNDTNYIKLRDLEGKSLGVDYVNGVVTLYIK